MNDEKEIQNLYQKYYAAMMEKNIPVLNAILDDSFQLVHMTGLHQNKQAYLQAIEDGTLNYRQCKHDAMPVEIHGNDAFLKGQTQVDAAVYGSDWHVWHLEQDIRLTKKNGKWMMMHAEASTY